ncbi:MAG: hypothetical protein VZR33_03895 [Methanosphaera sp.]|nr:hypothetical protein [Methanosphaera sp.]
MAKIFKKLSILGLLLVMFMSVAMAAEVTEDTTTEVTIPSTEIEETTEVVETDNVEQVAQTRSYNPISTDTVINDSTWDNQAYDVTSNVKITTNITQSNNIAFNLNGNNITIDGLNIVNDETQPICINIASGSYDINIINTNVTIVNNETTETMGIIINGANDVLVDNCKVDIKAVSQDLYLPPNWVYSLKTSAILTDNSDNITISNNIVNIGTSTNTGSSSGTGEAITVRNNAHDVQVINNTIIGQDFPYLYGISTSGFSYDLVLLNNTIQMTGINHFCGIQLASTSNSTIRRNTITGTCSATSGQTASLEGFAYGIALSSSYRPTASESTNNLIEYNNINITSNVTYAIELSIADNTKVYNNTAYVYGEVVMALGLYNSSSCEIKENNFTVSGNSRELNPWAYDAITPQTTGIKLVDDGYNNTKNNVITGNIIRITDSNSTITVYSVILENTSDANVTYNYLTYDWSIFNYRILDNGYNSTIDPNSWLL